MAIDPAAPPQPPVFLNVRKVASALNTYDDPQDIADTECSDCLNVVFERNGPSPRKGSVLAWSKPTGETGTIRNTINAINSARVEYTLAIYGTNFYVRDETNNQWIKINGAYTASATYISFPYGWAIWNAGVGSDALYFGNGREDTLKWGIVMDYLTVQTASGSGTLTVANGGQFPATGSIILKQPGLSEISLTYSSKSGNVLTLTSSVGQVIGIGAAVTMAITDLSPGTVPKGKIFAKFQGRLFIANSLGLETTLYYSNVGTPEDFSVHGTPSGGGFYGFIQGVGEITGMFDFGQYLGILKADSVHRFEFVIDSTNATKIDQVTPLVSDNSMGCPYFKQWLKKNNTLYYPSATSGIFAISPVVTGFQTTINLEVLDLKIHNLYQSLVFTNGRSIAHDTKIFFSCATNTAIDTILVYDTLRQYWTRFNNWPVGDWFVHNGNLYFCSYIDGNIYQCFDSSYTDNNNPYTSYAVTKRYDFGSGSMPKTMSRLFMQGYMNTSTTLYCDVMFNEMGQQQTVTYQILGTQPYVVQPITPALAQIMLGFPIMGGSGLDSENLQAIFKIYLGLAIRYGFFNIQFKFYSTAAASNWVVTGIGMNPRVESKTPENLVIGPDGTVPVPTPTVSTEA